MQLILPYVDTHDVGAGLRREACPGVPRPLIAIETIGSIDMLRRGLEFA